MYHHILLFLTLNNFNSYCLLWYPTCLNNLQNNYVATLLMLIITRPISLYLLPLLFVLLKINL